MVMADGDWDSPSDILTMALTIPHTTDTVEDTMILIIQTGADMADIMVDTTPTMVAHTGAVTTMDTTMDTGTAITMVQEIATGMEGLTTDTITDTPVHPIQLTEALRVLPMLTPDTGAAQDQLDLRQELPVNPLPTGRRSRPGSRVQMIKEPIVVTIMEMIAPTTIARTGEILTGIRIQVTEPRQLVR